MGLGFKQIEQQLDGFENELEKFSKKISDLKKNLKILKEQYGLTDEMKDYDRHAITQWLSKKAKELFKNPEIKPTEDQFRDAFERAKPYWLKDINQELNKKISLMQLERYIEQFIEQKFENGTTIN